MPLDPEIKLFAHLFYDTMTAFLNNVTIFNEFSLILEVKTSYLFAWECHGKEDTQNWTNSAKIRFYQYRMFIWWLSITSSQILLNFFSFHFHFKLVWKSQQLVIFWLFLSWL